ncbi:MAG: Roadblock/LC7 protein, putative GTPase-activating (GAP) component of G-protein-coupled receptor (GPCR) system [uncultured Acidimicrobiales bacterium]|uniref:Roadblock/LC7 protein, putative GTPase-activating (GAP) component of G-protein-coupled receptor (GPCR) system n=1 Tax=uncultured Acidimicrobiales bacterium TaxID=310071 RepID=A0A6J4HZA4_9ACTN|nr:MAG: Roadblock/LC7 protein, putative GTPase-activating (GAP) component of G-protein-coupled receptor (GPCR) system [uncultured Acidimicrobiales bacterium]
MAENLNWLLDDFVKRVPETRSAIVVSVDGLLMALSKDVDRTVGDSLSAVVAGITSLTQGAARFFNTGGVNQVIVEMEYGFLFVMSIGEGSSLAVVTTATCDIGLIGYEMAVLVGRAREALDTALISDLQASLPR